MMTSTSRSSFQTKGDSHFHPILANVKAVAPIGPFTSLQALLAAAAPSWSPSVAC